MKFGVAINKWIVPILEMEGYQIIGKSESNTWNFIEVNHCKKIISIQKSNLRKNAFQILLDTNKKPKVPKINIYKLIKGQETGYWWEYREDNVQEILMNACKAIVEWGIPYLDEVGNPELEPPLSAQHDLLNNAGRLAATFNEKYEVVGSNEEYVKQIQEKLLEQKLLCYEPDWDFIIIASAALGENLIRNYRLKWKWSDKSNSAVITINIGGNHLEISPLRWVAYFWGKPHVYGYDLYSKYMGIQTFLESVDK